MRTFLGDGGILEVIVGKARPPYAAPTARSTQIARRRPAHATDERPLPAPKGCIRNDEALRSKAERYRFSSPASALIFVRIEAMPVAECLNRFSLLRAFEARGVTPRLSGRSWSGLRDDDGTVMFAIRAADIQVDAQGCRCVLWAPANAHEEGWLDTQSAAARLGHCRLALRHGSAAAFVVHGENMLVDAEHSLALRVVRSGEEYWGRWGLVAPRQGWKERVRPSLRYRERRLAAA
jgi:hypothetical protein